MKMTMHIDEDLLKRVMEIHGCESKTDAVDFALRELDRRHRLREYAKTGLGLTREELLEAVEPGYDPIALRGFAESTAAVAEDRGSYLTKNAKRDSR
jgi:Arc/MetJ family transcription regulator